MSQPADTTATAYRLPGMVFTVCLLTALVVTSFKSYLLFHILAEIFSVVIAFTFFVIAWNGRRFFDNHYLLFLGIAFLFIGFLDLIHTLGYRGMEIFARRDANLATQLWIGARYLEAVSFLAAFFFIRRPLAVNGLLLLYGMVTGLILLAIFQWGLFPDCWVDGQGLTSFKKTSEYVICAMLLLGMGLLHSQRDSFQQDILTLLRWAQFATVGAELSFTFYVDIYGFSNLVGHLLKITAFFCLYKAVVEITLESPIKTLYHNITSARDALAIANQELSASQMQLEMAQEIAKLGHWHWEIDRGRLIWSKEVFRIFGLDPQRTQPSYELFLQAIPERERSRVMEDVGTVLDQPGTHYQAEHSIRRPDGTLRYVLARGEVIRDQGGRAVAMLGTVLDLTHRHQVEEKLRVLSQAVEQSPSSIVIADRRGVIQYVNPTFIATSGYSQEELTGHAISLIKSGVTPPEVFQDLWRTISSGRIWRGDLCNRRKSGELYWEFANISPIRDPNGQITLFLGIKNDITDKKRLEEEKQQALDRAEQANRAKSEFLAIMSHEIRTPMNGVLGMADLMLATPLTDRQRHYVETIRRSGRTLLRIINDILDFSKIQAGRLVMDIIRFNLDEVMRDVHGLLVEQAQSKGLSCHFEMGEGVPAHLLGDPYRLNQILFNLVGNAIKFTAEGSVRVSVAVMEKREADVLLGFQVTDTGIGIAPEFQNRLFRPFSQEDPSVSRRFGGTGLGLAITRQLVVMMNGTLWVESMPEQGSTFRFTIRFGLQQPGDRREIAVWQAIQRPATPDNIRFSGRILLVEDNPVNQEVAVATLERFGCQVTVAGDGRRAIQAVCDAAEPFDAIFMDCELPVLNGFETTRHLRRWEIQTGRARVPIIALTAHVLQESRQQCRESGMDDYLQKPFNHAEMGNLLHRWLPPGSGVAEPGAPASPDPVREASHPPVSSAEALPCGWIGAGEAVSGSVPVLDPVVLGGVAELARKSGAGLLGRMVDHYLTRIPEVLAELETALERNDADGIRFAAHSLRSSSVTLGAARMVELGRCMEIHHQDFALIRRACQQCGPEFVDVKRAMNDLLAAQTLETGTSG
ncbi:MAG: PAS domain S-box protein [Magnetococcales bacterium]|nr:PAS domain S-box protein [Magnetococcales bacterium]